MIRWSAPEDIDPGLAGTVCTIGVFDGVHRGHRAVIEETVRQARALDMPALALTFDPHPRSVHAPQDAVPLVTTLDDRLDRLEALGIDIAYVQHYTLDYAAASARDFIESQLIDQLRARAIVVGEDVRFGRGNEGDGEFLRRVAAEHGVSVTLLDDLTDTRTDRRWSSTWVREMLKGGNVECAARVLGRPHRLRGTVIHGFKRGRQLGFPTANLLAEDAGVVPEDGVYAGWLIRSVGPAATEHLPAAISIGSNPQFDGQTRTVEAHVLGRADLDLYGEDIALDFIAHLRPILRFSSVDELLEQMDEDLRHTAQALGVPVAGRVDPALVTAGAEQAAGGAGLES